MHARRAYIATGMRRIIRCTGLSALLACPAAAQVAEHRVGAWPDSTGGPTATFAVVRWTTPWNHAEARAYAESVGARLASLPTVESLSEAVALCRETAFWQCAGPWIGPVRDPSTSWRWHEGQPVSPSAWAPGRPAQAAGLPACMLLSGDGSPDGGITDALDATFGQPATSSALLQWTGPVDCDGDGLPDPFQISLDPASDTDLDGVPDRCVAGSGDLDGSGFVDFGDVSIAMLDFGPCVDCAADLDHSGVVDFGDIAVLMLQFGTAGMPA